jgi:hypothetical protein
VDKDRNQITEPVSKLFQRKNMMKLLRTTHLTADAAKPWTGELICVQ